MYALGVEVVTGAEVVKGFSTIVSVASHGWVTAGAEVVVTAALRLSPHAFTTSDTPSVLSRYPPRVVSPVFRAASIAAWVGFLPVSSACIDARTADFAASGSVLNPGNISAML